MLLKEKTDKKEKLKKKTIDYKNVENVRRFITDRGKVLPRRITGISMQFQKEVKKAVKRARYMALVPFVADE